MKNQTMPQTSDIDFVLTWVDGSDMQWQESKSHYRNPEEKFNRNNVRYRDWNLLHYWFRSVEAYAPWVRKIHVVTCGQVPDFLKREHPKLHLVNHTDYIPNQFLPTFNTNPILLNLHRIEGLAEKFVNFNDDVYLTAPVTPEDFFLNGLPRNCAAMNLPVADRTGVGPIVMNNLGVLADHFDFMTQFRKNWKKYLSPVYGTKNLRTLMLLPWKRYVGFLDLHLTLPLLKSTFEQVWAQEEDLLNTVSSHKFRSDSDVSEWLMSYWQMASGNFMPGSPKIGKAFYVTGTVDPIVEIIRNQSMKVICINDDDSLEDFTALRDQLVRAFDTHLGQKCSFEK